MTINCLHSAFYKYNYSNFDKDNFVSDFTKINWNENKKTTPGVVNDKVYNLCDKVFYVFKNIPLIKLSRKQLSLRAKPWITVRISIAEKCFDIWGILKMATVKSVEPRNNSFSI